jgi:putative selenate reductase
VTLSTIHGCPPDEIEKFGLYLIAEKKLHTIFNLHPTLFVKERLSRIIKKSSFETITPNEAFERDLKYPDALKIIHTLKKTADKTRFILV